MLFLEFTEDLERGSTRYGIFLQYEVYNTLIGEVGYG